MATDDLRRRLEALNGGPLATPPSGIGLDSMPTAPSIPAGRRARKGTDAGANAAFAVFDAATRESSLITPLTESLDRHVLGEARSLADGRGYYHVETSLSETDGFSTARIVSVCSILESASFRDHLRRPSTARASEAVFLDLETLGLHDKPLFLIGLLTLNTDGSAICSQLLARDLTEETAILDRCASRLHGAKLLLTFNGKSFDVPFLKSRFERHGLRAPRIPTHVDLLVEARIRYRGRLHDCRLQTLERHLCGRIRDGDVPGAQIPEVYRRCIQTCDAGPLANILLHNRLDLATTAELVSHFWGES